MSPASHHHDEWQDKNLDFIEPHSGAAGRDLQPVVQAIGEWGASLLTGDARIWG